MGFGRRCVQVCSGFKCSSSGAALLLLGSSCLSNREQDVDEPVAATLGTQCSSSSGGCSPESRGLCVPAAAPLLGSRAPLKQQTSVFCGSAEPHNHLKVLQLLRNALGCDSSVIINH